MSHLRRAMLASAATALALPVAWGLSAGVAQRAKEELERVRMRTGLRFAAASWSHPPHNSFDGERLLGLDRSIVDECERRLGIPCAVLFGRDFSDSALMIQGARADAIPFMRTSDVTKHELLATQDYTANYLALWAPRRSRISTTHALKGKIVGVLKGTSEANTAAIGADMLKFELREFSDDVRGRDALRDDLLTGRIAAAFMWSVLVGAMRFKALRSVGSDELDIEHKRLDDDTAVFDTVPQCFGVDPRLPAVRAALDALISDIKADGTLDRLTRGALGLSQKELRITEASLPNRHRHGGTS